ncbi:hypothetical protein Tco_1097973 [Tanacetum coccineum]
MVNNIAKCMTSSSHDQLSTFLKELAKALWNWSVTLKSVIKLKYTTSTTKTKAAKYDNIKGIEDMVMELWSPVKVAYDKFAMWGISHWGPKRQKFYSYTSNMESKHEVEDQTLHKFKEGDFPRLNMHDIEDLLLLLVQKKLSNLEQDVIFDLNVALSMFIKRIVILKRVEDLQLGVESHQKKHSITNPETFRSDISKLTPYTA